jgi:glutamate-1-semialdehyde aminotransferase
MHKIPLYSKDPTRTGLPMYYDKAKECNIWIGNRKYIDMSYMGIGCNILGYANKKIDKEVMNAIKKGNMSSLNPRINKKLAELILKQNKWAHVARYARTGGEAMKIAYDLAREKRGKESTVYTVGYNGWHIKNLQHKNIEEINNIDDKLERPDILIFELIRHKHPRSGTIDLINRWQKDGTLLIVDEITSGFRYNFGGYHQIANIRPDICVYAKGISNGYPMAIILTTKEFEYNNTWISSTYWSESIGVTSAYYTIKELEKKEYYILYSNGCKIKGIWRRLSNKTGLQINISETSQIARMEFNYKNKDVILKIFTKKMQEYNILATDQYYASFAHKEKHFKLYEKACEKVFKYIKKNVWLVSQK